MSIFDSNIDVKSLGKVAVLMGSLFAGILGSVLINIIHGIESRKSVVKA